MQRNESELRMALSHLKQAREYLTLNRCPQAADKVRRAMKSAEGALRNARSQNSRATRAT